MKCVMLLRIMDIRNIYNNKYIININIGPNSINRYLIDLISARNRLTKYLKYLFTTLEHCTITIQKLIPQLNTYL